MTGAGELNVRRVVVGARVWVVAVVACLLPSCASAPQPHPQTLPPRVTAAAPRVSAWPRREVFDLALEAYQCGRRLGYFHRPLLTVIDYSLPSTEKRLWVIDMQRKRVLFNELVAHGRNSGEEYPVAFSNRDGSKQSSLGLFRADDPYEGGHGWALHLTGLEPGVNDRADARRIVMHGARYVSAEHIAHFGQLGRSWGCPALPEGVHERIIDRIRGGSAVFAYYPDPNWLGQSRFLHCGGPLAQQ